MVPDWLRNSWQKAQTMLGPKPLPKWFATDFYAAPKVSRNRDPFPETVRYDAKREGNEDRYKIYKIVVVPRQDEIKKNKRVSRYTVKIGGVATFSRHEAERHLRRLEADLVSRRWKKTFETRIHSTRDAEFLEPAVRPIRGRAVVGHKVQALT